MLIALAFMVAIGLRAQTDTISLRYFSPDYADPFLKNLSELQNVSQLGVTVAGESLKDKRIVYRCHRVLDGVSSIVSQLPKAVPIKSDSVKFIFGARPIDSDSVFFVIDCPMLSKGGISVATEGRILMETYPPHSFTRSDTIPIMAYTTGIPHRMKIGSEIVEAMNYCGLRGTCASIGMV